MYLSEIHKKRCKKNKPKITNSIYQLTSTYASLLYVYACGPENLKKPRYHNFLNLFYKQRFIYFSYKSKESLR